MRKNRERQCIFESETASQNNMLIQGFLFIEIKDILFVNGKCITVQWTVY